MTTKQNIGFGAIIRLRRIEARANELGFRFAHSKYGSREIDVIALYPIDDKLPPYARDAELFVGDLDEVNSFLIGMDFMANYYRQLRIITDAKVQRGEELVREGHLIQKLKGESVKK